MKILGQEFLDTKKADWKRLIALLKLRHIHGGRVIKKAPTLVNAVYLIEFQDNRGHGWYDVYLVSPRILGNDVIRIDGKEFRHNYAAYNMWGPLSPKQLFYIQVFSRVIPDEKKFREHVKKRMKKDLIAHVDSQSAVAEKTARTA